MTSQQNPADQPLSKSAKAGLSLLAALTISGCYLFWSISIVLLLTLIAIETVLAGIGARFGLLRLFGEIIQQHVQLLGLFFRSFWLKRGTDYRVILQRAEAPRLFAMIDQLGARLAIAPPNEVSIEMSSGAWVRLEGYRRGAGRTVLGVGYDLLAGLTESEVEAVLAHEMVHSKLVQRWLATWLNKGVYRSAILTSQLSARAEGFRRIDNRSSSTEFFLRTSDWLTSTAARLVAAYSRQDEFEADRGAAELCGAGSLGNALRRLEDISEKLARMPWRERVGQLELEEKFHAWLTRELHPDVTPPTAPENAHVRDPYSTHPSLRDRIAALPPDDGRPRDIESGVELLADPDQVARVLMREIQRIVAAQEQKDTKNLSRLSKKLQSTSHIRWQQVPGIIVVIVGGFVGIMAFATDSWVGPVLAGVAVIAFGVVTYRFGRYRDKRKPPVPSYATLKKAWTEERPKNLNESEKTIEAELNQLTAGEKRKRRFERLLDETEKAFLQGDYLRAHVGARLAQAIDARTDVAVFLGVAAAGLGLTDQMEIMLRSVRKHTGFNTRGTTWGAAWAFVLVGAWDVAEAFLWQLVQKEPEQTTFLSLLAIAQARRGKLQGAIQNAQRAATLAPKEPENIKLYAQLLLDGGRLREAGEQLQALDALGAADAEIAVLKLRWHLSRREHDAAVQHTDWLQQRDSGAHWLLRAAESFESARLDDKAGQLFEGALATAHYPEAHLGLARIATTRRDKTKARHHLLSALDFQKTVGPRGQGPGPIFHQILNGLLGLEDLQERCSAWVVQVPRNFSTAAVAGHFFMVYGADQQTAEQHFLTLIGALQPDSPRPVGGFSWRSAPKDRQPDRPVRPGVQFVM